jgi:hypothetical protein
VPTLAASWDSDLGKATLTVTGQALSGTYVSQYYDVHRSDDSGAIYDSVRNGDELIPNASFVAVAVDYEAPRGIVAFYRVRSVGVDSNGNEFPSDWSGISQVLITNDDTWWFKAIDDPSYNLGSIRVLAQLDTNIEEPNTVFRPLGSTRPIVVAGPLQGEDGIYSIKTVTETEWDDLYELIEYQGTILVQDPQGNQKYIRVIARTWSAESKADGIIHRNLDLAYVEVDG